MKRVTYGFFSILTAGFLSLPSAFSMTEISNTELESVSGQAGISILFNNINSDLSISSLIISDMDGTGGTSAAGHLIMTPIKTTSGGFRINRLDSAFISQHIGDTTGYDYSGIQYKPLEIDLCTAGAQIAGTDITAGMGYIDIGLPTLQINLFNLEPIEFSVNSNATTGGPLLGALSMTNSYFECTGGTSYISPRSNGSEGFDFYFNNAGFYWLTEEFSIQATSGYWADYDNNEVNPQSEPSFVLNDFLIQGVGGGPWTILTGKVSFDCYTDTTWNRSIARTTMSFDDNLDLSLGQMNFFGVPFGSWALQDINIYDDATLKIAGKSDGIEFAIDLRADIGSFRYEYAPGLFNDSQNIHLAENFVNYSFTRESGWFTSYPGQIEKDSNGYLIDDFAIHPDAQNTTWVSDTTASTDITGDFRIGDMENNRPVSLDIHTDSNSAIVISTAQDLSDTTLNSQISGSLFMENLRVGDNDFGAHCFSGIDIKYLQIILPGTL